MRKVNTTCNSVQPRQLPRARHGALLSAAVPARTVPTFPLRIAPLPRARPRRSQPPPCHLLPSPHLPRRPALPNIYIPPVGGEKKVLIRHYSGIITMRISGVGATEPPRSRRWLLTRESAALSVLPPSERVTGCGRSGDGRNRSLASDSPHGRAVGGSAAAAGGRGVKFRVSGGSGARCGGGCFLRRGTRWRRPSRARGSGERHGEGGTWCMGERSRLRGE